jgi:glycine betaine/proline transport system substrate-binding protein
MHIHPLRFLLILILFLAACGGGDAEPEPEDAPTVEPTEQAADDQDGEQNGDIAQAAESTDEPEDEPTDEPEEEPADEPEDTSTGDTDNDTIRMAQATWDTGWFQAAIYTQLLEELGYEVSDPETLSPEEFYPALAEGEYDLWVNGWFPLHTADISGEGSRNIVPIGSQARGSALQGYLIDKLTADTSGITSLADLQDPAVAELFDADGNGKADLIGCNEGWGCEAVINHHLEEYGLADTVEHVQGNYSDLMLDGIDRFEEGEPILFYTWTPNWPLNKLETGSDVIWLEVPYASLPEDEDMASQESMTTVPNIEGCASSPCNLGFPLNDIRAVANQAFLDANPAALRLLELVQIPLEDIVEQNDTMFFGEDSPEDIRRQAENWIAQNEVQVSAWLEEAAAWEQLPTLARVQERGVLRCGIQEDLIGFSTPNSDGSYSGFNADFCRAVAAAALGDAEAVEFVPLDTSERFAAISDRRVDVLFHNVTWLARRDVGMTPPNSGIRLAFGPTLFHDGQRFMVSTESGITQLNELAGRTICVLASSTAEDTLVEQLVVREVADFEVNRQDTVDAMYDTYERGGCDVVTADTSELVARRAGFVNPGNHTILGEQISREPHSPVFVENDAEWGDVVSWAVNTTIYAEELGISSANVEEMLETDNPDIARLLGQRGQIGNELGVDNDFAYTIIRDIGSYKEIYDRNIGPGTELDLERGPNKTWNSPEGPGGLLSAPPFR